ncbi:putative low-complexity protein [Actinobacteria bacterium IMCC26256]|nr:putative low-complexity protein [Actinobacteria bacterium IMCC26256]
MGDGASSKARSDDDDTVGASKGSRNRRRRRRVATGVFACIVVASAVVGVAVRVSKSSTAGTLVTGPSGAICDFKVSGDCQNMNLNGVVVRGVDLTGMKFNGSSLNGADFTGSTFTNTDLTGATFIGAILDGVKSGGVIGKKSLKTSCDSQIDYGDIGCELWLQSVQFNAPIYCYPIEWWMACLGLAPDGDIATVPQSDGRKQWLPAQWQFVDGYLVGPRANLGGASLGASDLSYINLSSAILNKAELQNATLKGSVVDYADLQGAALRGSWEKEVGSFNGVIVSYGTQLRVEDCVWGSAVAVSRGIWGGGYIEHGFWDVLTNAIVLGRFPGCSDNSPNPGPRTAPTNTCTTRLITWSSSLGFDTAAQKANPGQVDPSIGDPAGSRLPDDTGPWKYNTYTGHLTQCPNPAEQTTTTTTTTRPLN